MSSRFARRGLQFSQVRHVSIKRLPVGREPPPKPKLPRRDELLRSIEQIAQTRDDPSTEDGAGAGIAGGDASLSKPQKITKDDLPPSPLTDAQFNNARFGALHGKPLGSGADQVSPYLHKLRKNVYAQALATPPRLELITQCHLPTFFMERFKLATNEETGDFWHLPHIAIQHAKFEAIKESSMAAVKEGEGIEEIPSSKTAVSHDGLEVTRIAANEFQEIADEERDRHEAEDDHEVEGLDNDISEGNLKANAKEFPGSWLLSSQETMSFVSSMPAKKRFWLLPLRLKQAATRRKARGLVWRQDMPTFLLEGMRVEAVKFIMRLLKARNQFWSPRKVHDADFKRVYQVGAVIWLGSTSEASFDGAPTAYTTFRSAFDARFENQHVPLYDLSKLLGEARVAELRARRPRSMDGDFAFLKLKKQSFDLLLHLMRLQTYIDSGKPQ